MATDLRARCLALIAGAVPVVVALWAIPSVAQPVLDQFIAGAQVVSKRECALLRVTFNVRLRYTGHAPLERGEGVRISFVQIDHSIRDGRRLYPREGVSIDKPDRAAVRSVVMDLDQAIGPVMRIQFTHPVAFVVGQVEDFKSIAVVISTKGPTGRCSMADFGLQAGARAEPSPDEARVGGAISERAKAKKTVAVTEQDMRSIEAWMDEGRAAIKKYKFDDAIQIFKRVLKYAENTHSAEAQQLLGLALQKAGRLAAARAEYEDYLRRYPGGEDSDSVRQRLAAIETATGPAPELPRPAMGPSDEPLPGKTLKPRDETLWSVTGGLSSFYIRDDSFNTMKDISTAPNPNADPDAHRTHQNMLLSNLDLFGTATNDQMRTKFRLAATQEQRLDTERSIFGVSTAFVETMFKENDLMFRLGRQSRNTGGVIGRFDGGVVSWQANDFMRLNAVGGSPNWSRFDEPFKANRYLFGASVDFGRMAGGLETSLFAIQQNDGSVIDRQAIGAEFRYFDKNKSALGTIDYDLHFRSLNAAILSGSWTLDDRSIVTGQLDYRKVPYLSSWNALQGQPFLTLYDMLKFNSASDIRQFALDRTPTFESAMVSYSRPLSEKWQIAADATVTHMSGTPPSGGIDGTPAIGTEYYVSGTFIGSNLFKPGDMMVGAIRYANLSDSNVYVLDVNARYPFNDNAFLMSPRLRLGYRTGKTTDLTEYTVLPTLLLHYLWTKDIALETEFGAKWLSKEETGIKSTTMDLFLTAGLRYDFHAEGRTHCAGAFVNCPSIFNVANPLSKGPLPRSNRDPIPSYVSSPAVSSAFVAEGGLRYWYSSGKIKYDYFAPSAMSLTTDMLVSRLSYEGLNAHSGEMFFRLDGVYGPFANAFLKGYVGGGLFPGGRLYDEDFPPFIDPYSRTVSNAKGNLAYATLDVGYNAFTQERFRLGAFVGFGYWQEKVNAFGCAQIGPNPAICGTSPMPNSIKVITEQDRWLSLRVGAVADVRITDRLTWNGELAFVAGWQRARDTHYFTFGAADADGRGIGFQAETLVNYQVTDAFKVGIGGRWWHFKTEATDAFDQQLKYHIDRYGGFLQATYRFN